MLVARILPLQEITLKLKIHFLLGKSEELVQPAFMLVSSTCCCDDDLFPNYFKPHLTIQDQNTVHKEPTIVQKHWCVG
jgi:hypothetical protein